MARPTISLPIKESVVLEDHPHTSLDQDANDQLAVPPIIAEQFHQLLPRVESLTTTVQTL